MAYDLTKMDCIIQYKFRVCFKKKLISEGIS